MKILSLTYDPRRTQWAASLPFSKSVALRAMTLNGVAEASGRQGAEICNLPDAEDVEGMARAMNLYFKQLRTIKGGGRLDDYEKVDIGQGGAPLRFFMALAASTPGVRIVLDCEESLKRRPHAILLQKLREAGADIVGEGETGDFPPYRIVGKRLANRNLTIDAGVSSQYISALMMAAPLWEGGLTLTLTGGRIVSLPYIRTTASLLEVYGIGVTIEGNTIQVATQGERRPEAPRTFAVPTDWSAASYLYELAAISNNYIRIESLTAPGSALQGDARIADIFNGLGVETEYNETGGGMLFTRPDRKLREFIELDLNDTPDLAPALTVGLCLTGVKFRLTNVGHLRHKETDRMAALTTELRKLGYILESGEETLSWNGGRCTAEARPTISTYKDHRMAMAFAPAAYRYPGLKIENPDVVGKSFPMYWEMLKELGFDILEEEIE